MFIDIFGRYGCVHFYLVQRGRKLYFRYLFFCQGRQCLQQLVNLFRRTKLQSVVSVQFVHKNKKAICSRGNKTGGLQVAMNIHICQCNSKPNKSYKITSCKVRTQRNRAKRLKRSTRHIKVLPISSIAGKLDYCHRTKRSCYNLPYAAPVLQEI